MARIGLISDTHGLLRPEALAALQGCDHIVHAGDIGDAAILGALAAIAPLTAVRGNNDLGEWAERLPLSARIAVRDRVIHVVHDIADLQIERENGRVDVVVSGHSHRPRMERRAGLLYVNPGSAGPRRFRLPITVAELMLGEGGIDARIVELVVAKTR